MFKVFFSDRFESQLQDFLSHLKQYYFNLYSDTGIISEEQILEEYEKSFDSLYILIRDTISTKAKEGLLGRKILENTNMYELSRNIFYVRSYRIMFESKVDTASQIVYIESLNITK